MLFVGNDTHSMIRGWKSACRKIKNAIIEADQRCLENESHRVLKNLRDEVNRLEEEAPKEIPTVIIEIPKDRP